MAEETARLKAEEKALKAKAKAERRRAKAEERAEQAERRRAKAEERAVQRRTREQAASAKRELAEAEQRRAAVEQIALNRLRGLPSAVSSAQPPMRLRGVSLIVDVWLMVVVCLMLRSLQLRHCLRWWSGQKLLAVWMASGLSVAL